MSNGILKINEKRERKTYVNSIKVLKHVKYDFLNNVKLPFVFTVGTQLF